MTIRPTLDVTEVILSVEFADVITVLRRAETVNNFGETTVEVQRFSNIIAVVTTPGVNELVRQADGAIVDNTITVITKFRLRSASKTPRTGQSYQPDIVVYQGNNYVADHPNDYSRYGAGFIEMVCTETDYIDNAPQ